MAIFTPGAGYVQPIVLAGTMLSIGAQKQPVATTATSNRKRPRRVTMRTGVGTVSGFTNLDNTILQLDARFDLLPNQLDWINYATDIAGDWSLCANCAPDAGAKKLFRQYNVNRQMMLLPWVDTPDVSATAQENEIVDLNFRINDPGLGTVAIVHTAGDPINTFMIVNVGHGLGNPCCTVTPADNGNPESSGAVFDTVSAAAKAVFPSLAPGTSAVQLVWICEAGADGSPSLRHQVLFNLDSF